LRPFAFDCSLWQTWQYFFITGVRSAGATTSFDDAADACGAARPTAMVRDGMRFDTSGARVLTAAVPAAAASRTAVDAAIATANLIDCLPSVAVRSW
jgi:hypothetical protein